LNDSISSPATTAGNGRTRYDSVAIALHWLTAAFVVAQFALSQVWGFFDKPIRHDLIVTHMSFGVLLTAVIVARIVWRLIPGHQVSPANSGWLEIASKAAHYSLYVLLASEAVLGFLLGWSGKNGALSFFGLSIPSPLMPFSRESPQPSSRFISDSLTPTDLVRNALTAAVPFSHEPGAWATS